MFQFTHPGRGATSDGHTCKGGARLVSIHAPREGCDCSSLEEVRIKGLFQFTHPGRGATHTPKVLQRLSLVSIHAPREGCDCIARAGRRCRYRFNSRTPGGVRPNTRTKTDLDKVFQFTHPGRGATDTA